jgi:hypothetical protein
MYLSYSGHKTYSVCPKQYWHSYLDKTAPEKPENKVNSLYGSVVGTLFEIFYADRLWMKKGVEELLLSMAEETLDRIVVKETQKGVVEYKDKDKASNYKDRAALLKDVRESIPRGIGIIRYHRLLGTDAEAEVKLDSWVGGHRIGGRADFIMTRLRPHGDLVILDGKGSKWREKYVDPWQLKWYAMLYREKHAAVPDALGFVFWRSDPEEGMDWVPFSRLDLDELKEAVLVSATHIEAGKAKLDEVGKAEQAQVLHELFPAKPSRDCKLCAFLATCMEGQAYESAVLPAAIFEADGVEDVGV